MKKKERHPVYALVMTGLILLLILGIVMLALGIREGPGRFYLPYGTSV